MCRLVEAGDSERDRVRLILDDERVMEIVGVVCGSGVIDHEALKHKLGLDGSTIERVLGALLSSGYIIKVASSIKLCGSCPFSDRCGYLRSKNEIEAYLPSEKLKRLCNDVART